MMMKKLILGLAVGMMIGSVTTAAAATQGEVTAIFANFILKINGQEKQLDTTPLVYDGTSYLPVRAISNLMGYDVTYTTETRTIGLNTRPDPATVTDNTYTSQPATQPATQPTAQPPVKSEPVDKTKWVSIRELSLAEDVKVSIIPGTSEINLAYGKQIFVFTLPNNSNAEKLTKSNVGNIQMLIKDGATYLNRLDLERNGLPH
jgi:hypothetical protein